MMQNHRSAFLSVILFSVLAGLVMPPRPAAASTIEERIGRLESELAELKELLKQQQQAQAEHSTGETSAEEAETNDFRAELYGFARLDASYDTGALQTGNIALWACAGGSDDGKWNISANASRLGLKLHGPDSKTMKLSGRVELDFLGGGAENQSNPRLRHAYATLSWPKHGLSLLAGQTWDLHSALIPPVSDPALLWGAGNTGMRHPQLRITRKFDLQENGRLEGAIALARAIGENNDAAESYNTDPGEDADLPVLQARLAYIKPLQSGQQLTIGVSGHYGEEEWDITPTGQSIDVPSWSCIAELGIPLSRTLALQGELFTGTNLDDHAGGIFQGVSTNGSTAREIRSSGGWGAFVWQATAHTRLSFGGGIDNPRDGDLADGDRCENRALFTALRTALTPHLVLGAQVAHWKTRYLGGDDAGVLRTQSSLSYLF
ncbi:MAG: DcaP family trimeric outer membrane transporter [Prosthecochloris sp.]|nr:DcaP family trimeric outer membrane transporter [Prosthecochloris sp.]